MIYRFYNEAPDNTHEYVKTILPLISNVTEFEVFKHQEHTPYVVIEDGEKQRYTFILKDNKDNEFWLYTLCGYHGSGPNATLKILQLLGLKKDFGICEEENIHIKKKNLKSEHKLNLLITQDHSASFSDDKVKYCFLICVDFKYAYEKQALIKSLKSIGYIQHVLQSDKNFYEKAYLFDDIETPEYEYYYYTNNVLTLNRKFKEFSEEQVEVLLKSMIEYNGGTINYESKID